MGVLALLIVLAIAGGLAFAAFTFTPKGDNQECVVHPAEPSDARSVIRTSISEFSRPSPH